MLASALAGLRPMNFLPPTGIFLCGSLPCILLSSCYFCALMHSVGSSHVVVGSSLLYFTIWGSSLNAASESHRRRIWGPNTKRFLRNFVHSQLPVLHLPINICRVARNLLELTVLGTRVEWLAENYVTSSIFHHWSVVGFILYLLIIDYSEAHLHVAGL